MSSFLENVSGCFLSVFAGTLYAVAIKYFVFPSRVIMTGTEGISIATAYFFDNQKKRLLPLEDLRHRREVLFDKRFEKN